jgi:hypothetical protein
MPTSCAASPGTRSERVDVPRHRRAKLVDESRTMAADEIGLSGHTFGVSDAPHPGCAHPSAIRLIQSAAATVVIMTSAAPERPPRSACEGVRGVSACASGLCEISRDRRFVQTL